MSSILFYSTRKPKSWTELARQGPARIFQHPFCRKISKKWRGPFCLARYCMLRWKKEQLLYFCSLCQMIQFDTLKFRRTLLNYFGQFVCIEKSHQYSRVSLHEASTKKNEMSCFYIHFSQGLAMPINLVVFCNGKLFEDQTQMLNSMDAKSAKVFQFNVILSYLTKCSIIQQKNAYNQRIVRIYGTNSAFWVLSILCSKFPHYKLRLR